MNHTPAATVTVHICNVVPGVEVDLRDVTIVVAHGHHARRAIGAPGQAAELGGHAVR